METTTKGNAELDLLVFDDDLHLLLASHRLESLLRLTQGIRDSDQRLQIHHASFEHVESRWEAARCVSRYTAHVDLFVGHCKGWEPV